MSWIGWIIKNLPAVISIIVEIGKLISGLPKEDRKSTTREMAAALKYARTSSDVIAINKLHKRLVVKKDAKV